MGQNFCLAIYSYWCGQNQKRFRSGDRKKSLYFNVKIHKRVLLTVINVFCMSLRPSSSPSPLTSSPGWCISTCTVLTAPCMALLITHSHTSMSVTSRMKQGPWTHSMPTFRWKSAGNWGISHTYSHSLSLLQAHSYSLHIY